VAPTLPRGEWQGFVVRGPGSGGERRVALVGWETPRRIAVQHGSTLRRFSVPSLPPDQHETHVLFHPPLPGENHVAERCLRDPDSVKLGGELRTVSILMSDLRGFSALSKRLGPQTMIELLNRYFARMVPVILAHGGTITEFIGDAILVLFGAPVVGPDDAARAVRCAWAMQRAMAASNHESRAAGLPELTMGIGLHVGRVVAGNIAGPDRVKYGVVGPPINLAARIESLTVGP